MFQLGRKLIPLAGCIIAAASLKAYPANAASFTLTDGSSSAAFNNNFGSPTSGFFNFSLDGGVTNQIFQTTTYFDSNAAFNFGGYREVIDDNFGLITPPPVNQPNPNTASITYTDLSNSFNLTLTYTLNELSPNTSELTQKVSVTNISGAPINFRFAEFYDLNLSGDNGTDDVASGDINSIRQSDGNFLASTTPLVKPDNQAPDNALISSNDLSTSISGSPNNLPALDLAAFPDPTPDPKYSVEYLFELAAGETTSYHVVTRIQPVPFEMAPAEMMGVVGGGIFGLLTAYKVRRKGEGVPKSKNESIL